MSIVKYLGMECELANGQKIKYGETFEMPEAEAITRHDVEIVNEVENKKTKERGNK